MNHNHRTPIHGPDGLLGWLQPDASSQPDRQVSIELTSGQTLRVPGELLQPQPGGGYFLPLAKSQIGQEEIVIPLAVEELQVDKRRTTQRVRFNKHVDQRTERVEDTGFKEEIEIERVAINQAVDTPPAIRREGDTTIVPLIEEVLVVEKRLIVREEVRITVSRRPNPPVEAELRSERLEVEPPEAKD